MAKDDMDLEIVLDDDESNRKGLITGIVGTLLLVAISIGLTVFVFSDGRSTSDPEDAPLAEDRIRYLELKPAFTSNFYVNGRARLLQMHISLAVRDDATEAAVQLHMPLIRHNLLDLIGRQDFDHLRTADGREELRAAILVSTRQTIEIETGRGGVENVLFTHFVMQ